MRKFLLLAAMVGLATLPAAAAPIDASGALRDALRSASPAVTPVWWHAGGTTAWGNHWHAGGTGYYGAHPTYGYHGYGGPVHYGTYYRPPVAVPYYNPGASFAAGAVVGGVAGAAIGAAAASSARPAATTVYNYSQPPTVVNNYYNN